MEIVEENTHRVLAYIETLNRHGVKPTGLQVDAFAKCPRPKRTRSNGFADLAGLRNRIVGEVEYEERSTEFLRRVGWITDNHLVELSDVGRALLRGLDTPSLHESVSDVFEIVLDPENPFAYAQALQALGSTGPALLIEPYFRLQQLMDIAELGSIERVLLGTKVSRQDRTHLANGLAVLSAERHLEVRVADELHDRYLIPAADESVLMLGSSLGGIGKKVSTLTTLGAVASQALRDAHESLWSTATPVEPTGSTEPDADGPAQGQPTNRS